MTSKILLPNRRLFLSQGFAGTTAIAGSILFTQPGLFAEKLATPPMVEGPFYPDKLPLDTDNDLLVLNDKLTPAVGVITHLHGKVLDWKGEPIRNAVVEIWQVDGRGVYLHQGSNEREKYDKNFQGFGRFLTGMNGEYYFRTVKPVPYPGRTPHIHMKVYVKNKPRLTTQLLVKGHRLNKRDGLFRSIRDPKLRELLLVDYQPLKGSEIGELTAEFNVILGKTPDETKKG